MSIFRNDTVGSWTRGGQAIVHNLRMTTQVFFQTMMAGLAIWAMGIIWYALEISTAYERFVLVKLAEAAIKVDAAQGTNDPVRFHTPEGRVYWTSADWLVASPLAKTTLHHFEVYLLHGALGDGNALWWIDLTARAAFPISSLAQAALSRSQFDDLLRRGMTLGWCLALDEPRGNVRRRVIEVDELDHGLIATEAKEAGEVWQIGDLGVHHERPGHLHARKIDAIAHGRSSDAPSTTPTLSRGSPVGFQGDARSDSHASGHPALR